MLAAGFAVVVIWGALNLVFRDWRAKYRERAAYGNAMVVPVINPLEKLVPPGVDAGLWREAVGQTRALLTTVIGSNLLDLRDMERLRGEIQQTVERAMAQPATACLELAGVWDSITERGEFLLRDSRSATGERHARPCALPSYAETRVVPAIDAFDGIVPAGVDSADWREAVHQTRAMLLAVVGSGNFSVAQLRVLRIELDQQVARARAQPDIAVTILATIWNEGTAALESLARAGRSPSNSRHPRPKILSPGPTPHKPAEPAPQANSQN